MKLKRWLAIAMSAMLVCLPVTVYAKSFSGGHSIVQSGPSYSSSTLSSGSTYHSGYKSYSLSQSQSTSAFSSSGTYHSGYKSPSSRVYSSTPSQGSYGANAPTPHSSFWSHLASFGAGFLLGNMFHPFGGFHYGHGYGGFGFSLLGIILDLLVLSFIVWLVRRLFFR